MMRGFSGKGPAGLMAAAWLAATSVSASAEGDRLVSQSNGSYRLEAHYVAPDGCHSISRIEIGAVMQSGFAAVGVTIHRAPGPCTMALETLTATATLPPYHALRGALVTFRTDFGKVLAVRRIAVPD